MIKFTSRMEKGTWSPKEERNARISPVLPSALRLAEWLVRSKCLVESFIERGWGILRLRGSETEVHLPHWQRRLVSFKFRIRNHSGLRVRRRGSVMFVLVH
jgi:hypothetical protein